MIIKEFDLFNGISDDIVEELVTTMETISYNDGEMVFNEGDAADGFYILERGSADLCMGGCDRAISIRLKSGDAFGWSSLVGRDEYASSVICDGPCRLYKINKNNLDRILRQYSSTGMLFYKRLAGLVGKRVISCHREMFKVRAGKG